MHPGPPEAPINLLNVDSIPIATADGNRILRRTVEERAIVRAVFCKHPHLDELWQLLLHDDIDDPGGNSFIK